MIVRNEAHVIERCLASVRPLISRWCIVDTGSSDDSPQIIESCLADLPGELHRREWVDFGHNRSEALILAGAATGGSDQWLLLIDADEELRIEADFVLAERSDIQAWQICQRPAASASEFHLPRLLRADYPWRFEGVLHEYLACDRPFEQAPIAGLSQVGHFDSARNRQPKQQKYLRDAEVLTAALEKDPDNARHRFYLAQSLRDAGEAERAILAYRKRAGMGGWDEEVYCALYETAQLLETTGAPHPEILAAYLEAWNFRPGRAEPLVALARLHRERNEHVIAGLFATRAAEIPRPSDILFVDTSVYLWRARDELSVASYWTGDRATATHLARALLESKHLPRSERPRIERNLEIFLSASMPAGTAE